MIVYGYVIKYGYIDKNNCDCSFIYCYTKENQLDRKLVLGLPMPNLEILPAPEKIQKFHDLLSKEPYRNCEIDYTSLNIYFDNLDDLNPKYSGIDLMSEIMDCDEDFCECNHEVNCDEDFCDCHNSDCDLGDSGPINSIYKTLL